MTMGERLANLNAEHQQSVENRTAWRVYTDDPAGREPAEIAAEIDALLTGTPAHS